jgi:hypothetical protein
MPPIAANDGRIVGIIYPPPEVRNIVDKTASFVARNGPEFEQRIKQNELNNPKFTFLNSGDPYNAYYEHKVEEIREGKDITPPPVAEVPKKVKYFFVGITYNAQWYMRVRKVKSKVFKKLLFNAFST